MLKMDQVHVLRHKVLKEGRSIRRVARELGLSRNTVAKYLDQPEPVRSSRRQRERPVWEAVSTAAGGADRGVGAADHRQATDHRDAASSSAQGGRLSGRQDVGG